MASMLCGPASQHHHHARLCPRPLCTPQFPAPTTCIQVPGDFLTAKTLNILCAVPNCHLFILSHRGTRQHHFKWFVLFTIHAHYSHSLPAQFKENVGHIFVDSTPLVKLPEVNATSTYYATHALLHSKGRASKYCNCGCATFIKLFLTISFTLSH